jgi:hypothetical protein
MRRQSSPPARLLVCALGAVVALVLVGLLAVVLTRGPSGASAAHAEGADRPGDGGPVPPVATLTAVPARRAGAVPPERPTTSRLPSGVVVPLQPADTRSDGSLAVPDDIHRAGWWRGGARLGDPFGSTLLAAHVDSFTQGLGPYSGLLSARAGDRIVVDSAHLEQTFSVVSLRLVPRGTLAQHHWIFSARGPRRLTLVTCAGPYDVARGGYQNLAIVTALPVSDPRTRERP